MTHKEKLREIFLEAGVDFQEEGSTIELFDGCKGVVAYIGFFTTFKFDIDGNLRQVEILE
jgi:hypothetical protein